MPFIALCMSNNISLVDWSNNGQIHREKIYFEEFLKIGYKMKVITYGEERDLKVLNSEIKVIPLYYLIKRNKNKLINFFLHFRRLNIYKESISKLDLIKTNQLSSSLLAILIYFIFKKKILLRIGFEPLMNYEIMHSNNALKKSNLRTKMYKFKMFFLGLISYNICSHIICTSKMQKDFLIKKFLLKKKKISIIPNWIDTKLFSPLKVKEKKNGVLYIGRLELEKNPLILIKAMAGINQKLTLIGSGNLRSEILELAQRNRVDIEIINPIPNNKLVSYYRKCKIYVIPSFYEGNPKTLLEAMSCGCTVIGNNVVGIREIINNERGIIFSNINELRNAIISLLDDPNEANTFGKKARKYIEKNNHINLCLKKEVKLISQLIN